MGERRAKAQVLIVDDDEKSREIIQLLLQRQGYDTREAESGEVALGMMGAQLPDLVLLDVEMGGINGFEILKQLKSDSSTRTIPIIMVTGLGDRESRLKSP